MTVQTATTVTLNPNTEFSVIKEYEEDKGWRKLSETTVAYVFELTSPQVHMDGVYLPSAEKGEPNDNT